jgi:HNH endonuclease
MPKDDLPEIMRILRNTSVYDVCWQWLAAHNETGYGRLGRIEELPEGAHRRAYLAFIGTIPEGLHVLHRCDNRGCVNPAHLFLGSHQDNMRDMKIKGRAGRVCGESHGTHKLTTAQVRMIRTSPRSNSDLARELGVSSVRVGQIRRGKGWTHVQ